MRPAFALLVLANVVLLGCLYAYTHRERDFATLCAYVDEQIDRHRCTEHETSTRKIGWVDDLDTAFAFARKTGRPVFILNGDGDICTGRL